MSVQVQATFYNAQELSALAQFMAFIEEKRFEAANAEVGEEETETQTGEAEPAETAQAETHDISAGTESFSIVAPAPQAAPPAPEPKASTTADVIEAVRKTPNDKVAAVIALFKEFGVARATEIQDKDAADFLDRYREVVG